MKQTFDYPILVHVPEKSGTTYQLYILRCEDISCAFRWNQVLKSGTKPIRIQCPRCNKNTGKQPWLGGTS